MIEKRSNERRKNRLEENVWGAMGTFLKIDRIYSRQSSRAIDIFLSNLLYQEKEPNK